MKETVYSPAPVLRSPRRFGRDAAADLRVVPAAAWTLFVRNLQARYRQTWLGYVWLLLPPAATTLVWVFLQNSGVISVGDTNVDYPVYVLTGTLFWQLFVDALNAPLQKLDNARAAVTKSRLPHEAWIASGLLEALFNFVIRFALTLVVVLLLGAAPGAELLLLPVGAGAVAVLGLALGLMLAPAGLVFRDVGQSLLIVTSLWFFLTPVIYPPPDAGLRTILVNLNPVTPLLTTARSWMVDSGDAASAAAFAGVTGGALVLLLASWIVYRVARPHLVARI